MNGICRLFDEPAKLRKSHIYPSFAVDYMKETGSQFLRTYSKPNQRKQDGLKPYSLSDKAEQRFGDNEKWFSEKIFNPYLHNNNKVFDYNEKLYYFAISFLWRVLVVNIDTNSQIKKEWFYNQINQVEKEWKSFLADYTFPINYNKVQLFLTGRVESISAEVKGFDYYTSRAMDGTIISNQNQTYLAIYGKFLRFIFWAVIKTDGNYTSNDSDINPLVGKIKIPQKINDNELMDFLINRSNQISKLPKPSDKQQERIFNEIMKDKDGFLNSDAGKAIINDRTKLDNN